MEMILRGHQSLISCLLKLSDGRVATGSFDDTLRIWNIKNGECEHVLRGHIDSIHCIIQLFDGRIATGSDDYTLRIWNVPRMPYDVRSQYKAYDLLFDFI